MSSLSPAEYGHQLDEVKQLLLGIREQLDQHKPPRLRRLGRSNRQVSKSYNTHDSHAALHVCCGNLSQKLDRMETGLQYLETQAVSILRPSTLKQLLIVVIKFQPPVIPDDHGNEAASHTEQTQSTDQKTFAPRPLPQTAPLPDSSSEVAFRSSSRPSITQVTPIQATSEASD